MGQCETKNEEPEQKEQNEKDCIQFMPEYIQKEEQTYIESNKFKPEKINREEQIQNESFQSKQESIRSKQQPYDLQQDAQQIRRAVDNHQLSIYINQIYYQKSSLSMILHILQDLF